MLEAPVIDGGLAVAVGDGFPLTPGHHLILSRRHEPNFFALRGEEVAAIMDVTARVRELIAERHAPDGFNIGVNVGVAGGQTVGHVHLHLIPRYDGDVADPRGGVRWILPERAPYWQRE